MLQKGVFQIKCIDDKLPEIRPKKKAGQSNPKLYHTLKSSASNMNCSCINCWWKSELCDLDVAEWVTYTWIQTRKEGTWNVNVAWCSKTRLKSCPNFRIYLYADQQTTANLL